MAQMASAAPVFDFEHPLLRDEDLREEVLDVMYAVIDRRLHGRRRAGFQRGADADKTIFGGVSADDVLQEAFEALLASPYRGVSVDWRAFGATIARNKAVDARRASQKGLRGTSHRHELRMVSGDVRVQADDGEPGATIFELHPDERYDPEEEYITVRSALDLRDLAREVLEGRDLDIYLQIRFLQRPRKIIGDEMGLTGQRVGQLYERACRRLENNPRYPYNITE